jgi:putative membrane protein
MKLRRRAGAGLLAIGLVAVSFGMSAVLAVPAALASPAKPWTAVAAGSAMSGQDRSFMAAAAQANMAELSISLNVEQRVTEPLDGVAARYVTDHTSALASLRKLAAGMGVALPSGPSSQQQAEASQIEGLSGRNLAVAFAKASVIAHEQAITLFRQEVRAGSNTRVKAYASDAMPMLNLHLSLAQQAASELGVAVSRMPAGAPQTGTGNTAGTQEAWLFGLGGAALVAGAAMLIYRRRPAASGTAGG